MLSKADERVNVVTRIPIDSIRPNPYQPRKFFDAIAIEELADSIREYGVIQPITVRALGQGSYELVSGERRLRASKAAELSEIPAIVMEIDEDDSAVIALIENLQRKDLNFFEEAEGYYYLLTEHGFTQEQLSKKIGKRQSTIANKTRLLKLPLQIRKMILESGLTERHARALLKIGDEELQIKVLQKIIDKQLNVSAAEAYIESELYRFLENRQLKSLRDKKATDKDFRIFLNTIKRALDMVKTAGVKAKTKQVEYDKYYEYIIRIDKK